MKIRPLQDRVLVQLDPCEEEFGDSGIVRPDIALDRQMFGTVLGVGPGVQTKRGFKPTTLQPGDRVAVPWRTGHDVSIGGRACVFVREGDVLGVE